MPLGLDRAAVGTDKMRPAGGVAAVRPFILSRAHQQLHMF